MITNPERFKFVLVLNKDTHIGFTSLAQIVGLLENQISNVDARANLMGEILAGETTEITEDLTVEFFSVDEYTETYDV